MARRPTRSRRTEFLGALGKWIAGVLGTVLAAVFGWLLLRPGGWLNPYPPPAAPAPAATVQAPLQAAISLLPTASPLRVYITEFEIRDAYELEEDRMASAVFAVYNEGDTVALECKVIWDVGPAPDSAWSSRFSLRPKETRQVTMTKLVYASGDITSRAHVECDNAVSGELRRYAHALSRLPYQPARPSGR